MSAIITRAGKGSPLTHTEVDANFNNLNNDKFEAGATFNSATRAQTEAALIAGANVTITPAGSGATRTLTIAASGGGGGGVTDGDKGDITVSGSGTVWTIDNGVVSLVKMADMATASFIGRDTAGTGPPEVITPAQARAILNVANGATANSSDATLLDRANHTGTQVSTTISDFTEAAQDAVGAMVNTSLIYNDATPSLARAALTGAVTAAQGSNTTALGTFTKALLDAAVSDGNVMYVGDAPTAHTHVAADVTDFATAVAANAAVAANTAKVTNATHTGDATGATALTLATVNSNVGSFGLAASVAQFTVNAKGLITAAVNVAISIASTAISDSTAAGRAFLTAATAAAQTALLDVFTSGAKGLAPASGGGTTNFLRADGTWAAAGGGSPVTVQDEGSNITTALGTLNFVGAGVTVTGGATSVVTIPGGGGSAEPLIGWFV